MSVPAPKSKGLLVPDSIINAPMRFPRGPYSEPPKETNENGSEQPKRVVPSNAHTQMTRAIARNFRDQAAPEKQATATKDPKPSENGSFKKADIKNDFPRRPELKVPAQEKTVVPNTSENESSKKAASMRDIPRRPEHKVTAQEQATATNVPFLPRRPKETAQENTAKVIKPPKNDSSKKKSGPLCAISEGKLDELVVYKLLVELFKNIENDSGIDFFVESLFHNMLLNSDNVIAVSKYVFLLSHMPGKGQTLRSSFFKFLQKHYNERNLILMSQGEECFRNFVHFFTAAVHHNRDPSIAPFDELMFSLLDLAEMFSSYMESPTDLKLFCVILVRFSQYKYLQTSTYTPKTIEKYWKVTDIVRSKILHLRDYESKSLIWLVMALEDFNRPVVSQFYVNNLDPHELEPVLQDAYKIKFPRSDSDMYKNIDSMGIHNLDKI